MSHELSQPEREGAPEQGQIFDIDSMTDEQIYMTHYYLELLTQ